MSTASTWAELEEELELELLEELELELLDELELLELLEEELDEESLLVSISASASTWAKVSTSLFMSTASTWALLLELLELDELELLELLEELELELLELLEEEELDESLWASRSTLVWANAPSDS